MSYLDFLSIELHRGFKRFKVDMQKNLCHLEHKIIITIIKIIIISINIIIIISLFYKNKKYKCNLYT